MWSRRIFSHREQYWACTVLIAPLCTRGTSASENPWFAYDMSHWSISGKASTKQPLTIYIFGEGPVIHHAFEERLPDMVVGADEAWNNDLIRSINNVDLPTRKVYVGFGLDFAILHDGDVVGTNEGFVRVAVFRESHDSTTAYGFGLL